MKAIDFVSFVFHAMTQIFYEISQQANRHFRIIFQHSSQTCHLDAVDASRLW